MKMIGREMIKLSFIKEKIHDLFSPVLSDKTIWKYNKKGLLIEDPLSVWQVQPNSVDLRLGNTWAKLEGNAIPEYQNGYHGDLLIHNPFVDPKSESNYVRGTFTDYHGSKYDKGYRIKSREFVLMASKEIVNIPNGIIAFVQGRSSIARLGIQTEQAGLIDSGFRGTITFEVFNQSDTEIILYEGMRIAQLYFFKSQYAMNLYGSRCGMSKYNGQIDATGTNIHLDMEFNNK